MKKEKTAKPTTEVAAPLQSFTLEDICPANSEVELNGKVYKLRKVNLEDEAWLKGQGDVQNAFLKEDMDFLAKFTFRLLVDKSDFLPKEIEDYDDDGNPLKKTLTGPTRVLQSLSGPSQKYELMKSLCVCIGVSRPLFDKMVADASKKNPLLNPTGEKSGT